MENYFIEILKQELVPALGCTEPISLAYAGAKVREILGDMPDKIQLFVSNNIIKNVKSVVVPMTNGLKGMDIACVLGVVGGNAQKELEVLADVTENHVKIAKNLVQANFCDIHSLKSCSTLHIIVVAYKDLHTAQVEIKDGHINVVMIKKDDQIIYEKQHQIQDEKEVECSFEDIYNFAQNVELSKIEKIILNQINCNVAICEEGLKNNYGKNVGATLLSNYPHDVNVLAKAYAAAGSDARMNGCAMPVVINSGSGNQGITVSVPIYIFAKEYNKSQEQLIRAVLLSNLVAIYLKKGIGKLSAYCGVVGASSGTAGGITMLMGGTLRQIKNAVTNTLADVSGIVCDGAKSSCAIKIASSVDAGIVSYYMAINNRVFDGGDGIVDSDFEKTIKNVSRLGKDGMKETDEEIIKIMLNK